MTRLPNMWKMFRKVIEKSLPASEINRGGNKRTPNKEKVSLDQIKKEFENIDDLVINEINHQGEIIYVVYLSTLIKSEVLQQMVMTPLTEMGDKSPEEVFITSQNVDMGDLQMLIRDIASGYTTLFFPKRNLVLKIDTFSVAERAISNPENETTVLGPQDAFIESLQTNLSIIKRRIHSNKLKTKMITLGTETNNSVAILYIEDIANEENVDRVFRRIQNIEYQGFVSLPILKQMLEDKPFSPFPQFGISARTDVALQSLLDGRVLVMLDGSPEAAILPSSFFEMFTSPEDFYNRWTTSSFIRSIRLFGFIISVLLTSTYVSVLTYHPEMLPPQLLTILSESRSQVPWPPMIEVLIIEMVIEIVREAGARMPTKIGQTIGIVGGIVIGTAAVEAGLASNVLIVLVAVTALLSFLPPNYLMSNAIRIVRYGFIIAGGALGMFGQMLFLAWMMNHLLNLTSLGSPYMTPVIPRKWTDVFNSVLRAPINFVVMRSGMSRAKKQLTRPLDEE